MGGLDWPGSAGRDRSICVCRTGLGGVIQICPPGAPQGESSFCHVGRLWSDVCPLRERLSVQARCAMLHTCPDRLVANGKSGVPRIVDPVRKLPTGPEAMGIRQSWGDAGGQAESVAMAHRSGSLRPAALGLKNQRRRWNKIPGRRNEFCC
jgi:hypothetical protein